MRILLDECPPARLCRNLPDYDVQTVPQAGWAGIKNDGQLLRPIADSGKFDAFVTVDQNLPRQQKIEGLSFAVIRRGPKSNRFADVIPFAPEMLRRLREFQPGRAYVPSGHH